MVEEQQVQESGADEWTASTFKPRNWEAQVLWSVEMSPAMGTGGEAEKSVR